MWRLVKAEWFINLPVMLVEDGCTIILRVMVRLMETSSGDDKKLLGDYHPCGATHEASVTDAFYDGFVDYDWDRKQDPGEGVIVWRGPKNNNGHATTKLNMNSWATAKS